MAHIVEYILASWGCTLRLCSVLVVVAALMLSLAVTTKIIPHDVLMEIVKDFGPSPR